MNDPLGASHFRKQKQAGQKARADRSTQVGEALDASKLPFDAVVIGSGYGGGVAASRLARMGLNVCVLERGRKWRPGEFSNAPLGLMKRTRFEGRRIKLGAPNALFNFKPGKQMHVLTGCGYGGGSLINAGLAYRPDNKVFARADWPQQVARDGHLETGFQRAEQMLGVERCPGGRDLGRFKALQVLADELDGAVELAPTTINYRPGFNRAGMMQSACTLCGDCWMGCNVGAKNTVGLTYLADAEQFGVRAFVNVKVSFVRKLDDGWRVFYDLLDEKTGKVLRKGSLKTKRVVLAAGVLGSTEILKRSQQKGLAVSKQLGRHFSANGDDLALVHDMPQTVNGVAVGYPPRSTTETPVGPNCLAVMRLADEGRRTDTLTLQAGAMLPLMAALAPLKNLLRLRLWRSVSILANGAYKGVLTKTLCLYAVGRDRANGELRLERDQLVLHWPEVGKQNVFSRTKSLLKGALKRLGAEYMQNPLRDSTLGGKLITVHPLGGCVMSEDVETGVVDDRGRVFDAGAAEEGAVHEGLYVLDGSIIPSSLGANPLLTITALAERAMILMAQEEDCAFDTDPAERMVRRDAFM